MADYSKLPAGGTLKPTPFNAHVDDAKLKQMIDLVRLSPVGPAVFENTNAGRRYGMQREWLENAKKHWSEQFNWRSHEKRINSYPNFKVPVKDDSGVEIEVHFMALFSEKADAIPLALYHGWPGSFLEFLDLLDVLKKKYPPKDLPYHVIVPSLPGYAYSSGPPLDQDYTIGQASKCLDNLMTGLGFSAYIAQGGDLGSFISREQGRSCEACKGLHLNMLAIRPPENADKLEADDLEKKALAGSQEFNSRGYAYASEHGTRTATIGLVLSASPLAMLSWIGEKFLEWSDVDPPLESILESVSLYWLTDTYPRCIYPYRGLVNRAPGSRDDYIEKPTGYSLFPKDIIGVPESWAKATHNLVSFNKHEDGGHFAAMEKPEVLLADVEEFISKAWKQPSGKL